MGAGYFSGEVMYTWIGRDENAGGRKILYTRLNAIQPGVLRGLHPRGGVIIVLLDPKTSSRPIFDNR